MKRSRSLLPQFPIPNPQSPIPRWLKRSLGFWIVPLMLMARPGMGADRLYVSYGPLEQTVSIEALEQYANTGELDRVLAFYARYFTDEQLAALRELLQSRVELSPVAVSQFLYTAQGEVLLERLGNVIQTESRLSGFYAIRSALILAASDPEGLTPINVLRRFPVQGIRVDVQETLQIVSALEQLINETNEASAAVIAQSNLEAANDPLNIAGLPDLRQRGNYSIQERTLILNDESRERIYAADIYLPITRTGRPLPAPAPLIVISHGLGSDRTAFSYLGQHLASYGFAVAIPEHPGSNASQLRALIEGIASEVTEPREFIDRPLDIKYLLDELERLSQLDPRYTRRIDVQNVGVIGQSFGGYTALALAGAPINIQQLNKDCADDNSFNLSLLLQCRALDLIAPTTQFRDERVKAVIAINPIGSSILGTDGFGAIQTPVMLVAGNADTVAPALLEQIRPFTWLTTPNKYLVLIDRATHFSTIGESEIGDVVSFPPEIIGPDPILARRYTSAMSVAFFQTYLANQPNFRRYLAAAYAKAISRSPLPLNLVRSLTPNQLTNLPSAQNDLSSSPTPTPPSSISNP